MTEQEARELATTLLGWTNIEVVDLGDDLWGITAFNPESLRRMIYNAITGHFEQYLLPFQF